MFSNQAKHNKVEPPPRRLPDAPHVDHPFSEKEPLSEIKDGFDREKKVWLKRAILLAGILLALLTAIAVLALINVVSNLPRYENRAMEDYFKIRM